MARLDFQVIATTLLGAVNQAVNGFLHVHSDQEPTVVPRPLLAEDKWYVSSFGEFYDSSYISVIYFYRNSKDREANRFCGVFVLYLKEALAPNLIKAFGYKDTAETNNEVVADITAELANNIAGVFKKDLSGLGYPELEISAPMKFKGSAGWLSYPKNEKQYYRVTAFVWGQKFALDVMVAI
ncbi:MAG: chemotaxis protein CheX [Candidatus Omnitrophica bacterium]|nr:chemotaxis protein CheX [Candidatus Omnitrophota bacterium]